MLLIWRGWGLLAVVSLFPLLASCAGLINLEPFWVFMVAVSGSLLFAGAVCVHYGTRWNRGGIEHSFYFVPLQVWGWAYLAAVGLFAVLMGGGGIFGMVQPIPGPPDPRRLDPVYMSVAGGLGLVIVVTTVWALTRSARPRPESSADAEPDNTGGYGGM